MWSGVWDFPEVEKSLPEVRAYTFRGNTFGQLDCYFRPTVSDQRVADRYNVTAARERAIRLREDAGLHRKASSIT